MGPFAGRSSASARERRRGQTETLGVVLLLGMTVIGAMSVVAFGATALQDARDTSGHESVGHAMTQFDSNAAIAALGEAETQSVRLGGSGAGSFTVEPGAGWINVSHVNDTDVETFVNTSLGALVYVDGDVKIAYQGGGVWKKRGEGSVMVSPPEFHYRDATLTLPIIQVNGSASASGSVRAALTNEVSARSVFPNASEGSYWDTNQYRNPVSEGNVTVTVKSEYYRAWAEYFRTRSDGEITVHHSNETVQLVLLTPSTLGGFDPMPGEGDSLAIQQLGDGHPVNDFNVTLKAGNPGQGNPSNFNGVEWSFTTDGVQEFEIYFTGSPCSNNNNELDVGIFYHNGSGYYEGWSASIDPDDDDQDVVDANCDEQELTINLTGTASLEYTDDVDTTFDTTSYEFDEEIVFNQHVVDGGSTYNSTQGDTEEIGFLINHYVQLLGPSVELTVTDNGGGNGNSAGQVDEDGSSGHLDYDQGDGPRYITFLHITENRVHVEFE